MKKFLSILLVITCLSLTGVSTAFATSAAPVVYVAADSSGDYSCDGIDDQIEINEALQFVADNPDYTTVYLKAGTYTIDDTIFIGSNTTLKGDSTTVLTIKSGAVWEKYKPMIQQKDSTGNTGITICGFKIDGNRFNITQGINIDSSENPKPIVNITGGQSYYTIISLKYCNDIKVYNMYLTNNHNDGLLLNRCTGIKFYSNNVDEIGHDGLYANYCTDIKAYNNIIKCRVNSGLRLYQSNNARFYNNIIYSNNTGGSGIEIQKYGNGYVMDDIEVFNNVIYDTVLAGIWIFGGQGTAYPVSDTDVHIYNNTIHNTGTRGNGTMVGGIVANGFNLHIYNNIIDGCCDAGIAIRDTLYSTIGTGYEVKINNNTIANTYSSTAEETGYGIYNALPDNYSISMNNNCFENNPGGNYVEP